MTDAEIMTVLREHLPHAYFNSPMAGLRFARALLAAGASEGQAIEHDVAFRDMSPAECCSSCGLTFGESTLLFEIKTGQKQAICSAEIAALRERIAGMEKEAEQYREAGVWEPDGKKFMTYRNENLNGKAMYVREEPKP